jgi:acetyltransferase-like isoleucine patch superfamily enzyme
MSEAPDHVLWSLWRRRALARSLPGFWASALSYASADCEFSAYNRIYRRVCLRSTRLGRMTYVAEGSRVGFASIGAFCSIGPSALIGGMGWHPSDRLSTHPAFYSSLHQAGRSFVDADRATELPFTTVGNDVWLGAGCIVLDGLSIGDGAIIAAGAVVSRPVAPYAIVGGVPARLIRPRFDPGVIAALLEWRWWELDDATLSSLAGEFFSPRPWSEARVRLLSARAKQLEVAASLPREAAV